MTEAGEDSESLAAERDELLQKLAENAEKAALDAETVAQLRDSLAKVWFRCTLSL